MPIQQAAAWWCFVPRLMPPDAFIQAVADIGYDAIDLAPQEHWATIRAHGLALSAINGHPSIIEGLNRRANHERIAQALAANIRLAAQWGAPHLICFSGSRAGLDDATGMEVTAEGLRRVAPLAEDAGVTLVLELLNSKVDHPDYQCDHTDWGVAVIEQVASPRVKLLYDIYHMQIMEGDLIRTIQQHHRHFAHYHTAGNPGRHEMDETQEIYYPPIYRAIRDTGYTGVICHEFIPVGDPVAALRDAFEMGRVALS